jgi:hypothetical protein
MNHFALRKPGQNMSRQIHCLTSDWRFKIQAPPTYDAASAATSLIKEFTQKIKLFRKPELSDIRADLSIMDEVFVETKILSSVSALSKICWICNVRRLREIPREGSLALCSIRNYEMFLHAVLKVRAVGRRRAPGATLGDTRPFVDTCKIRPFVDASRRAIILW